MTDRKPVAVGVPGHAEGHSTNAAVAVGAAFAVKQAMDQYGLNAGMLNLCTKAKKVAEGAALMTGATWKENILSAVWPTRDNQTKAEIVQSNIELFGMPVWTDEEQFLAERIQKALPINSSYCWSWSWNMSRRRFRSFSRRFKTRTKG